MVSVNQQTLSHPHRNNSNNYYGPKHALWALGMLVGIYIVGSVFLFLGGESSSSMDGSTTKNNGDSSSYTTADEDRQLRTERVNRPNRPSSVHVVLDESTWIQNAAAAEERQKAAACQCGSFRDLSPSEMNPRKGTRHMVDPPAGGKASLVCCDTTAGKLSILAHHKWAPHGAQRFVDMVTSGYFDTGVPLMRCVKGFLCQFGLNADPSKKGEFRDNIPDDPNWLPEGPTARQNEQGVKRFAQGYLAFAGAGNRTRSKQLIVSLKANGPLAGGSPWEVPWGEIVHPESFETLSKIFTGYGDDGPPQGKLTAHGMTEEMRAEWPDLDYVNSCYLVDQTTLPDKTPFRPPAKGIKKR